MTTDASPQATFAFLWSAAALVLPLTLRRILHPGIYLGFDLLASIAVLATTVLAFTMGHSYSCAKGDCNRATLRNVEIFAVSMGLLTAYVQVFQKFRCLELIFRYSLLHLMQLVWACRALHRHRTAREG